MSAIRPDTALRQAPPVVNTPNPTTPPHEPVEPDQWVIWNGQFGLIHTATIGRVAQGARGRVAWMDKPFEMLGPFDLDALEASGRIVFAACLVLSPQRWQADQVALRRESREKRRAAQQRLHDEQARRQQRSGHAPHRSQGRPPDERQLRETLKLPADGRLEAAQVKAAYRRLAQRAHPDMGGSQALFVRITEARNALLEGLA